MYLPLIRVEDEKEKYTSVKLDAITMEYNFLLSSQLEAQRAFFEKQVSYHYFS